MKVTKVYCDVCEKEITDDAVLGYTLNQGKLCIAMADLCPECTGKVLDAMKKPVKNKVEIPADIF
jgi:hypothetical protein